MKNLLDVLRDSFYNPRFYRDIAQVPMKEAFRFYAKLSLLLSIATTAVMTLIYVPQGVSFIRDYAPQFIETHIDADLVLTLEDGNVSVNVPEPHIISAQGMYGMGESNLLVIDTTKPFSLDDFRAYNTLVLVTETEIVTRGNYGEIAIQSTQTLKDTTVSRATLEESLATAERYLPLFVVGFVLVALLIVLASFAIFLVPLLLFATFPYFLGWIHKTPLSYKAAYTMSLYAIAPGLVLKSLLNSLGFFFFPTYLNLLLFLIIVAINMAHHDRA